MGNQAIRTGRALAAAFGLTAAWAVALASAEPAGEGGTPTLEPVLKEQIVTDEAAIASQGRVNELSDEAREMLLQYRQYLTETRNLDEYTKQLSVQVDSQLQEIEFVKQQLVELETTAQTVLPLMQKMLDTLDKFVAADLPFLKDERRKRIAGLRDAMGRADVTISEKYRRIIEAYQIETDYGRSIEAYQGELDEARTVRFLRVGRVALLYQTLDGEETGYWDAQQKAWVRDDSYRSAVRHGFAVADKAIAPDLLTVPIPAPTAPPAESRS
jgi:hypothetical protein